MQTNLTIALAQLEIATDPAVNLSKAEVFTHQAASQGADIIVFPGYRFVSKGIFVKISSIKQHTH